MTRICTGKQQAQGQGQGWCVGRGSASAGVSAGVWSCRNGDARTGDRGKTRASARVKFWAKFMARVRFRFFRGYYIVPLNSILLINSFFFLCVPEYLLKANKIVNIDTRRAVTLSRDFGVRGYINPS